MIQIRPVSDLRNKFPEIEMFVNAEQPVYLTKNGYGTMVVLRLEKYASLVDNVEMELDEADEIAETTEERLSHDDVEAVISERLNSPLAFEPHPSVKKRKHPHYRFYIRNYVVVEDVMEVLRFLYGARDIERYL
ncbi:MAG TPA: type II toxin-antitoxin system Phd/YefM family antitoxin [Candidatus Ruminococcus avistercoris]|nr:type II toxin-antitoxin system Phd/YefM family antitoxin [Candidatus Ruminococcus avistercoris]